MKKPDPLKTIPLFRALTERDRQRIACDVVESHYTKDQFIFREGDPADYFYILKTGAVKCVKSSPQGKDVTLKVLMPGDLFCCDAAAFDGTPHPGCAQPMGDVTLLRLSKKCYFDLLRRHPDAALEIIKYLGKRLNEAQEHAKVLALDRAEQRMAVLLVDLAMRTGVEEADGLRLSVRLTRQDLADMTGIASETAIRIMSRFKQARLVSGTANRLVVRDLARLKQLASVSSSPLPVGLSAR
ncbi:MAG TPA: Crp/Fnr family transcriptional regulator [Nitrospiraceae bacterium]|nr:Crp/Fnr family transcriptional regulator [Nitrospiraceae bacterium]